MLNANWTRFDDIVKLYPSWHFAENFTIFGKLSVPYATTAIFPNVLQESIVIIPNAIAIWLSGSMSAPFFLAAILTGFTAVLTAQMLRTWTGMPVLSLAGGFWMIFTYHIFSPDRLALMMGDPFFLVDFIKNQVNKPFNYNSFYRVHTLGATYLIFLAYIYWLWHALKYKQAGTVSVLVELHPKLIQVLH